MKYLWKNVIDMPPTWLFIFMGLAWIQARTYNPAALVSGSWFWTGWLIIALGVALAAVSFLMFRRHGTSVVPRNTPKAMITTGPYRFSRNPIYLADALILLGFVLLQGSVVGLAFVPVFMALIQARFITGEEMGIRAEFGEVFDHYCLTTRRWL